MLETLTLDANRMRTAYASRMYESHIQRTHARTYVDMHPPQICLLTAVPRGGYEKFSSDSAENAGKVFASLDARSGFDA